MNGRRWVGVGPALLAALSAGGCGGAASEEPWRAEMDRLAAAGRPLEALEMAAAAGAEAQPAADLAAARLLFTYRRVGWALDLLRELREKYPEHPEVLDLHYQTAAANQLYEEAVTSATALRERRPGDGRLLRHLGVLKLQLRDPAGALPDLEEASRRDPESFATWYVLGRALEMPNRDREALAAYRRALEIDPSHAEARWRAARLLVRFGELDEAERRLAALGAGADPAPKVLYLMGTLEVRRGETEAGRRLLATYDRLFHEQEERAEARRRYNAQLVEVVFRLAEPPAAGEPRRVALALERAREFAGEHGDERLAVLEAELALRQGRGAAAIETLAPAVGIRPRDWRIRYLLAEALHGLGLDVRALAELEVALRLQPLAIEARRLRVRCLPAAALEERSREEVRVKLLERFDRKWGGPPAPPELEQLVQDERAALLFDVVQMHPLAQLADEEALPMD